MRGWEELGDRVFSRRYEPWDVTVGAVIGDRGLLVVDTRASADQAEELLADLRFPDRRPPAWVVNTHAHFDHSFGNGQFRPVEIWAHASVPGALRDGRHDAPGGHESPGVALVEPDHLVSDAATIDLGDRVVELHHVGRAHTDGDLIVWVPDAAVVFAGDLVEESGPPAYGPDSFPLDWPAALERLRDRAADAGERVVPGHGAVVDRAFVTRQQRAVATVARLVKELWSEGVPVEDVLGAGGDRWPFPPDRLVEAVRRAYAQLSAGAGTSG